MVGIIVGPGHHSAELLSQLTALQMSYRVAYSWPHLNLWEFDEKGNKRMVATSKMFDTSSYLITGIWNRLNIPGKKRFHLDYLYPLYDRTVAPYMKNCEVVIGWSQVSLKTIKEVKKRGGKFILEHPMPHIEFGNNVVKGEVETHKIGKSVPLYSYRTSSMIKRMKEEYALADKINLLSTFARQTFIDYGVPEEKLQITPLGIDASPYYPDSSLQKDKFIVLYVGRLELWKGVHYLMRAFAELNLPDAELWLAGPVKPEINMFMEKYQGKFRYLGVKNKAELAELYRQSDVFVLPSINEAFGLVILEAMASGVPVIATQNTGAPDIIEDGHDGYVIPTRNVERIKESILKLYHAPSERMLMGKRARKKILEHYSLTQYSKHIKNLLDNV